MTRKRNASGQVITAFVRIPKPLEDGKVRCNGCMAVVALTPNGHLRKHRTPAGEDCAYQATYATPIPLDELPPVDLPNPPRQKPRARDGSNAWQDGECKHCGKWLPNGRTVCGYCMATKGRP